MKVLLVYGKHEDRAFVGGALASLSCSMIEATNGAEGIESAVLALPDLIISDTDLPAVDGFDFLRAVRFAKSIRSVPFVFYAEATENGIEERARALGADGFISKPKNAEEFITELKQTCAFSGGAGTAGKGMSPNIGGGGTGRSGEMAGGVCGFNASSREADGVTGECGTGDDIFQSFRDAYFRVDLQGNLIRLGPSLANRLGYLPAEVIGSPVQSIFPDARELQTLMDATRAGVRVRDFEFQTVGRDGRQLDLSVDVQLVRGMNGLPVAIEGVARDISERKMVESQLRQSQKMEALGTLCGGIAHDFNNILTAIIGFANVLLLRLESEGEGLCGLTRNIIAAAERAANLTTSLLAFSRKQPFELRSADLNKVVTDMESLLAKLLPATIRLSISVSAGKLQIEADPGKLGQLLTHLATNARDAMPDGGEISIRTVRSGIDDEFVRKHGFGVPGRYALLVFSDTGHGMQEGTRQRVFEPFFTTKERGKGTGLGLSIVYGVVKQHGGFISCSSAPGNGTEFSLYFPLVEEGAKEI